MSHIKIIIVALSQVVRKEQRENCIERRGFYTVTEQFLFLIYLRRLDKNDISHNCFHFGKYKIKLFTETQIKI
jgi:hypothetical protein